MQHMKRTVSILLIILFILCRPSTPALAAESRGEPDSVDISITDSEIEQLEYVALVNSDPKSSGLIYEKKMLLAKDGSSLVISGETKCISGVVKCGFTYIKIQRYVNGSWTDYVTYTDIYADSNNCKCSKRVAGITGYKYRVVARHYAKKTLFNTESIITTTGTLSL